MKAAEMKKGQSVKWDGKLYVIIDFEHVKCGKGGAIYQTKLKSITDGLIANARIRSEEYIEEISLDKRKYEYLYSEAAGHVLMDLETFDQITLDNDAFGDGNCRIDLGSFGSNRTRWAGGLGHGRCRQGSNCDDLNLNPHRDNIETYGMGET
jgi:translation elongation factor P/translation initiation factor 5A